jgi:predicted component of type VI protein secretion system
MERILNQALDADGGLENSKRMTRLEGRFALFSAIEMATFIIRQKGCEPQVAIFDKVQVTIGRSSRNDICIGDRFASRFHAELKRKGDQVFLSDAYSANGTYLNGQRVSAPTPLRPGDLIRIGVTEIEYSFGEQDLLS